LRASTSDPDAHRADASSFISKRERGRDEGSAPTLLYKGLSSPIQYQSSDMNDELLYGELVVVGYSDYRMISHNEYIPVGIANERFQLKRRYEITVTCYLLLFVSFYTQKLEIPFLTRAVSNGKKIARVYSNGFTDRIYEEKVDSKSGFEVQDADENEGTNNIFFGNSVSDEFTHYHDSCI
jgi:hypothetical protein